MEEVFIINGIYISKSYKNYHQFNGYLEGVYTTYISSYSNNLVFQIEYLSKEEEKEHKNEQNR